MEDKESKVFILVKQIAMDFLCVRTATEKQNRCPHREKDSPIIYFNLLELGCGSAIGDADLIKLPIVN